MSVIKACFSVLKAPVNTSAIIRSLGEFLYTFFFRNSSFIFKMVSIKTVEEYVDSLKIILEDISDGKYF